MITLSPVCTAHAVLQKNRPIRIFGTCKNGGTVTFAGRTQSVGDGEFCLTFPAMEAGGPYTITTVSEGQTQEYGDIFVGTVILLSGQSNAELPLNETFDNGLHARRDSLRLFVARRPFDKSETPPPEEIMCYDAWKTLTEENTQYWSAFAYHIGQAIEGPVGIVECDKGATKIQAFMSRELVSSFALDPAQIRTDPFCYHWNEDGFLFESMIKKVAPVTVSAVVWMQGESNVSAYENRFYAAMLQGMMDQWRQTLDLPDLPFIIIGINDWPEKGRPGIIEFRQTQQQAVVNDGKSYYVDISDLGEYAMIHPRNKREASARVLEKLLPLLEG